MSRNDAGDPSESTAADPDEVEAILLVAQSVMEKRPKRSGRGPEKHDEGPILLGRRGQWILSPNTNLSRPRIPSPPSEFSREGESRGVTLKSPLPPPHKWSPLPAGNFFISPPA